MKYTNPETWQKERESLCSQSVANNTTKMSMYSVIETNASSFFNANANAIIYAFGMESQFCMGNLFIV